MTERRLNLRRTNAGVTVPVRLTPKSSRDEVTGVEMFGEDTVLKARVRAVPDSGRANQALERLVADWLGVPPSSVSVVQGGKSRMKQVAIAGDADALAALVAARIGELQG